MATLTLELPRHKAQTASNLRRWAELLADRELAKVEGRIETDRFGHIIMSPPAAHGPGPHRMPDLDRRRRQSGRRRLGLARMHEGFGAASLFYPRTGDRRGSY